ncbi:MAG: hypothetical protein K5771_03095 [Oscillospiraceae bacterium]|nr:hypothetical protein [Oscillospiraceae bacterium]
MAWLIEDLRALPADRKELEIINNPLVYDYKQRHIADIERLLSQLEEQERIVIERLVIKRERATAISVDTDLTSRQVFEIKENAIDKLLRLRHGVGYRP